MAIKLHAALPSLPAALDEIRDINDKVNHDLAIAHIDYDTHAVPELTAVLENIHQRLSQNATAVAAVLKVIKDGAAD